MSATSSVYMCLCVRVHRVPHHVPHVSHMPRVSQTDQESCPVCGHDYVQQLVTKTEFKADQDRMEQNYQERLDKYNKLTTQAKAAKSKGGEGKKNMPPRRRSSNLVQEYMCVCFQLSDKGCPECHGKAKRVQDPDGSLGAMISSCAVCQCTCNLGPFKDSQRADLHAQYLEYKDSKKEAPTVSASRPSGVGSLKEAAQIAMIVSAYDMCCSKLGISLTL